MRVRFTKISPLALAAVAIFSGHQAQAQFQRNDFLVLNNGDTLRGEIRQKPRFQGAVDKKVTEVKFRPRGGKLTSYTSDQIISYGQDYTVQQISRTVAGRPNTVFVTPIVNGPISAYTGQDLNANKRFFFSTSDTSKLVELDPRSYRLQYVKTLTGCSELDFFDDLTVARYPYTYKGITSLVTRYNACRYPERASRVVKLPSSWYFRPGVKLGLTTVAKYYVIDAPFNDDELRQSPQPSIGLFVRATNRSPFGLQGELSYNRVKLEREGKNVFTGGGIFRMDRLTNVEFSVLQASVLGNLFLHRGLISPFVNAGVLVGTRIQEKATVEYRRSDQPVPEIISFPDRGTTTFGGIIGAGLTFAVYKKSLLSLEYRHQYLSDGYNRSAPMRDVRQIELGFSL